MIQCEPTDVRKSSQAYTLIELLAVIAIIAVLASLLMPAFVSAKESAKKSVCFSHFKQAATATAMYLGDYDELYMPISYRPGQASTSRNDRTWVQLLLPYAPNFSVFQCPADTSRKPNLDATFDADLVPGDLYSAYYNASKRTNLGYNYMSLSPVVKVGGNWRPAPRKESEIDSPSSTMLFLDSVWSVDAQGHPDGGGNWLVVPPCRFATENGKVIDLLASGPYEFADIFAVSRGWQPGTFGNAWPWHFQRVNVAGADTHAESLSTTQLASGCDVKPYWNGEEDKTSQSYWFANLK